MTEAEMQQAYLEMCAATEQADIATAKANELIKGFDDLKRLTMLGHAIFWLSGVFIGTLIAKHWGWCG